jgi:hypothetical protein
VFQFCPNLPWEPVAWQLRRVGVKPEEVVAAVAVAAGGDGDA